MLRTTHGGRGEGISDAVKMDEMEQGKKALPKLWVKALGNSPLYWQTSASWPTERNDSKSHCRVVDRNQLVLHLKRLHLKRLGISATHCLFVGILPIHKVHDGDGGQYVDARGLVVAPVEQVLSGSVHVHSRCLLKACTEEILYQLCSVVCRV